MQEMVTDFFGRPLQDLRISVIDRCNFRCTYCMPAEVFGPDYAFLKWASKKICNHLLHRHPPFL
ncbi:hypothetical protein ACT453_60275, partial [Bacillus sp. D-CC]